MAGAPLGGQAEVGLIPDRYLFTEMPNHGGYLERTKANVQDSDTTLIISMSSELTGGTRKTVTFAKQLRRPWMHIHPGKDYKVSMVGWLESTPIQTLTVAGASASGQPQVALFVHQVLDSALECFGQTKW